jgi:hypothetical protein
LYKDRSCKKDALMSARYLTGMIKRYWLLSWVAFAPVLLAQANTASQNGQSAAGGLEQLRSARAVRVERAPKLDGTLNDPLWQKASPATDLVQREPFEGRTPTERTEVRVLYTRTAVFFGVNCLDSNPAGIVATELRRDVSQELDDYFEIVIDSAHDRRNAYVFQVNPLGTQRDALITEEQRTDSGVGDGDSGWDGVLTLPAENVLHNAQG